MSSAAVLVGAQPVRSDRTLRQQCLALTVACTLLLALVFPLALGNRYSIQELARRRERTSQLVADAQATVAARGQPAQVREDSLPTADLLQRIDVALKSASIDPRALVSAVPQPPRRISGTDRAEVGHRLLLEDVALEPLARFCEQVSRLSADLHLTAIQLRASANPDRWSAEVVLACYVIDRR
jgi:hypothetical protein